MTGLGEYTTEELEAELELRKQELKERDDDQL